MYSAFMDRQISIKLENGIYVFQQDSSTGKTYLFKLLRRLWDLGEPVIAFTWEDERMRSDITSVAKPGENKVLMFDRYDRYIGKYYELMREFAKTGIVLIDCKGELGIDYECCLIKLSNDRIEVVG